MSFSLGHVSPEFGSVSFAFGAGLLGSVVGFGSVWPGRYFQCVWGGGNALVCQLDGLSVHGWCTRPSMLVGGYYHLIAGALSIESAL